MPLPFVSRYPIDAPQRLSLGSSVRAPLAPNPGDATAYRYAIGVNSVTFYYHHPTPHPYLSKLTTCYDKLVMNALWRVDRVGDMHLVISL